MKLSVIQWMYMDVHFKLVSEEQSFTVLMNPIMQSVKGHENSLPAQSTEISLVPKAGWGLIIFVQKTNF